MEPVQKFAIIIIKSFYSEGNIHFTKDQIRWVLASWDSPVNRRIVLKSKAWFLWGKEGVWCNWIRSAGRLQGFIWVMCFLPVQCCVYADPLSVPGDYEGEAWPCLQPLFDAPRPGHHDLGIFSLPLLDSVKRQLFCCKSKSKVVSLSVALPRLARVREPLGKRQCIAAGEDGDLKNLR